MDKPKSIDQLIGEPTLSEKANINEKNIPVKTKEDYNQRKSLNTLPPKSHSEDRTGKSVCGKCRMF